MQTAEEKLAFVKMMLNKLNDDAKMRLAKIKEIESRINNHN